MKTNIQFTSNLSSRIAPQRQVVPVSCIYFWNIACSFLFVFLCFNINACIQRFLHLFFSLGSRFWRSLHISMYSVSLLYYFNGFHQMAIILSILVEQLNSLSSKKYLRSNSRSKIYQTSNAGVVGRVRELFGSPLPEGKSLTCAYGTL